MTITPGSSLTVIITFVTLRFAVEDFTVEQVYIISFYNNVFDFHDFADHNDDIYEKLDDVLFYFRIRSKRIAINNYLTTFK